MFGWRESLPAEGERRDGDQIIVKYSADDTCIYLFNIMLNINRYITSDSPVSTCVRYVQDYFAWLN